MLIRVFTVRSVSNGGPKLSSYRQRNLWSDLADAFADPSLLVTKSHLLVGDGCNPFPNFNNSVSTTRQYSLLHC